MIKPFFHRWERRLASVSRAERVVRDFDWGLDWIDAVTGLDKPKGLSPPTVAVTGLDKPKGLSPPAVSDRGDKPSGLSIVSSWVDAVMKDTDAFFTPATTHDYTLTPSPSDLRAAGEAGTLVFPSGFTTPHPENNLVRARYFPANPFRRSRRATDRVRRAVVVLAQWNANRGGHVGLCQMLARLGIASLRISLPYHDERMPPELKRADYIVSANVVRTVQVCRQAVMDVRRALWWLRDQGYERLGLLGTSLGSCLSLLTTCHEPLVQAQALNHISPFFSDVVWRGLSTEHVRTGLDGHVTLDELRSMWRPINPWSYLDRVRGRQTLLVYAKYDLTFPVDLSLLFVDEFRRRQITVEVGVLPCGHYTTGQAPFKFLDGWYLGKFLATRL
ncbi:MAG: alpha/beta hydrolase family protein [Vicinamibacterales bacterium]